MKRTATILATSFAALAVLAGTATASPDADVDGEVKRDKVQVDAEAKNGNQKVESDNEIKFR